MIPGPQEWLVILLIILILFGASKLPEVARSLGRSIAEFKKAQREAEMEIRELEKEEKAKKEK